jgi:hypothetical protein
MGREIKRVPLDFDWPLDKVWAGFLRPERLSEEQCLHCDGNGYSAFARRQQARWYGNVPFSPAETGSTPFTPTAPAVVALAERNVDRAPEFYGRGQFAIVREAVRLAEHFNRSWSHHLHQDDVDALVEAGRLMDFTHTWTKSEGWQPKDPKPVVTAEQVNTWSRRIRARLGQLLGRRQGRLRAGRTAGDVRLLRRPRQPRAVRRPARRSRGVDRRGAADR